MSSERERDEFERMRLVEQIERDRAVCGLTDTRGRRRGEFWETIMEEMAPTSHVDRRLPTG